MSKQIPFQFKFNGRIPAESHSLATGSIQIKEYQDSSWNVKELLGGCDAASSPAQPPKIWFSLLLQSLQLVVHPKVFLQPTKNIYINRTYNYG